MNSNQYKFSYYPNYSDLFYVSIFLLVGGTILLLKYPFGIIPLWIIVIVGIFLFVKRKSKILFYEDFVEIISGFGKKKKIIRIEYKDIQYIEYVFAEIRGNHLFKIVFKKSEKIYKLQYSFLGNPTKVEIGLLDKKQIKIKITPESSRYKIETEQ